MNRSLSPKARSPVTVSVGITLFPDHGRDSQELISRADEAMYSIKRTGKGAWRMWSAF